MSGSSKVNYTKEQLLGELQSSVNIMNNNRVIKNSSSSNTHTHVEHVVHYAVISYKKSSFQVQYYNTVIL